MSDNLTPEMIESSLSKQKHHWLNTDRKSLINKYVAEGKTADEITDLLFNGEDKIEKVVVKRSIVSYLNRKLQKMKSKAQEANSMSTKNSKQRKESKTDFDDETE